MAKQNGGLFSGVMVNFFWGKEAAQQMDILKTRRFQQGKYIYKDFNC